MLMNQKISSSPETNPALDQQQLFAAGMDYVRQLSGRLWTDHNIHDPGITTLELLCYTLTDLAYRAQFPIEDLLATESENSKNMANQFFTPRQVLPNRPLTTSDYRKLLIDMKGVKNAWVFPADGVKLKGLYKVLLELDETIAEPDSIAADAIKIDAMELLQANRNLCEDFVGITIVEHQYYSLCAELELEPDADQVCIAARLQFEVECYLSPPVLNHSLSEMLARKHEDGTPYTVAEIFEGPPLRHGFIDDVELEKSELRRDIYLSDIISIIMDIEGVLAVRNLIVNQLGELKPGVYHSIAPVDKWRLKVPQGKQPHLAANLVAKPDNKWLRLVFYKRNLPMMADADEIKAQMETLVGSLQVKLNTPSDEDLPVPLGRFRNTGAYRSFQHHFPELYGLSEQGLPTNADPQRKALALQLKGYLLFFDQIMANFSSQLANVRELFSHDTKILQTYFAQIVETFPDAGCIYADGVSPKKLQDMLENEGAATARRNRFLDHLLSRLAEDFHHYVSITHSKFGVDVDRAITLKYKFLKDCPKLGEKRSLAYNYTLKEPENLWDSSNVSGLERRLARLLGIADFRRRNLGKKHNTGEGMYLIENILLRPQTKEDPSLNICADADDPYSYRLHIILPAHADRFKKMDFRRYVEETIRLELPAHILPKICWVDAKDMEALEDAYHKWIPLQAGVTTADRKSTLQLFDTLCHIKNVYPRQLLHDCGTNTKKPPFILGRTVLGSDDPGT